MTATSLQSKFLEKFECLGAECPDTCCKGWNMQLDNDTFQKYTKEAPELLNAVAEDPSGNRIMRRDKDTDYCVRFEDGLCGIHRERGTDFLGDACFFYPRATRGVGELRVRTAVTSCPEVARLAFYGEAGAMSYTPLDAERMPFSLKDYQQEELTPQQVVAIHDAFLAAVDDETISAEQALLRMSSVARSLEHLPRASWPEAVPFYLKSADDRLPDAQIIPEDPFNLLHALWGIVVASRKDPSPRLNETLEEMKQALGVMLSWDDAGITTAADSLPKFYDIQERWHLHYKDEYRDVLKRWLQLQLALNFFPFSGLGESAEEKITFIGVRFATFRLALMCSCGIAGECIPQDVVVRVAQTLARVLDHLSNPRFSLDIFSETGWIRENRLRGLITL